ncbi:dTDP-4-amino-4,6-dideoxygalactose transaminase [Rhodopirellula rubra]|uniref:dTDP-4-amino-4,6-dideoxygalactose transaminase n=1 Tax=Aporhodopirellula rubra TaxID=980271 RepID=A0A7W5H771_9BACT|nr:DegT/DnrJ/EryC1/StrS family aminotransferase [Aporhodopirellula rubra]MBB3207651.1 dTDP-4-amino-4,6-dideoxygalactose transaminase [Aporhodopirellula rubra]
MSDHHSYALPRCRDGWPIWPPRDPAIIESIERVWADGDWGRYHSAIHEKCAAQVADLATCSITSESQLGSPWSEYHERLSISPDVRLCSSGSAAIELALRASGVTAGDEVIVAAYDYPGNFRTIELLGATPVLADVRSGGVTMDPASLQWITGEAIRAVVVSHLYGELADIAEIRKICDERNWILIEDACQTPGAGWRPRQTTAASDDNDSLIPIGALADVATLSFGGSKLLSAGNGGAIITRNDRVAARLRTYADRPSDVFAFSPLQCAALIPQLGTLNTYNRTRRESVNRLGNWDWHQWNATPLSETTNHQTQAFYKFAIRVDADTERASVFDRLSRIGLPAGEGFRSMHATSDRRSRKPVSLDHSRALGERCVVIDHRVLLADDLIERLDSIAE